MDKVKLEILVENTVQRRDLLAEHGFALSISVGENKVLFDTGQGMVLEQNAQKMGFNLEEFTKIILSHGHYDHTGGLKFFFNRGQHIIYAHPNTFNGHYFSRKNKNHYIGTPFSLQEMEKAGLSFVLHKEPQEILPGVIISGEIPRVLENNYAPFVRPVSDEVWEEDPIIDDQFLLVTTEWGVVLILGCTHAGLANTMYYANKLSGGRRIRAVLGGMHLSEYGWEELDEKIKVLQEFAVEYVAPLHCTGFLAMCRLRGIYGDKYISAPAGTRIIIEDNNMAVRR